MPYNIDGRESGADESEIRVGFVTYHKELHFYNVKVTVFLYHNMLGSKKILQHCR